jgi:exodeoxyribonuclease V beta subunit
LAKAVFDRRYDLQHLLYILALHRYLQQRVPRYHYDQHMGGAYYLFLRGLRPEHGPHYGVYFDLPPHSLIDELDKRIFGVYPATEGLR